MHLIEITIEILAVTLMFAVAVIVTVRRGRPAPVFDARPIRPRVGSYARRSRN
jgi:hypothetical protein